MAGYIIAFLRQSLKISDMIIEHNSQCSFMYLIHLPYQRFFNTMYQNIHIYGQ